MKLALAMALLTAVGTVTGCGGSSRDTEVFAVTVTHVEAVKKGGTEMLELDGLPSASGTLVQQRSPRHLNAAD